MSLHAEEFSLFPAIQGGDTGPDRIAFIAAPKSGLASFPGWEMGADDLGRPMDPPGYFLIPAVGRTVVFLVGALRG